MTTPLDLVAYNRKWLRLHEHNKYQAEAARRITALLDEVERLRALITPRTNAVAVRADSARTKQVSEFLGDRIHKLRAQRNEARAERDRAREECGYEKRMRAFVSEERDRFIDAKKSAEAERDNLAATVDRVRELVDDGMQHVYVEQDDEYGVLLYDLRAAIEGTDS